MVTGDAFTTGASTGAFVPRSGTVMEAMLLPPEGILHLSQARHVTSLWSKTQSRSQRARIRPSQPSKPWSDRGGAPTTSWEPRPLVDCLRQTSKGGSCPPSSLGSDPLEDLSKGPSIQVPSCLAREIDVYSILLEPRQQSLPCHLLLPSHLKPPDASGTPSSVPPTHLSRAVGCEVESCHLVLFQ